LYRRSKGALPAGSILQAATIHLGGFRTCDLSRVKRDQGDAVPPPEQGRLF
jgi:hypothetical protein